MAANKHRVTMYLKSFTISRNTKCSLPSHERGIPVRMRICHSLPMAAGERDGENGVIFIQVY